MRPKLKLRQAETSFFTPYIIYDEVDYLNPVTSKIEKRKRTVGVSFSDSGEIIIATTICSPVDAYSTKVAIAKVTGRIIGMINRVDDLNSHVGDAYAWGQCFYFRNNLVMIESVNVIDQAIKCLYPTYNRHNYFVKEKTFIDARYIQNLYLTFMTKIEEMEEMVELDIKEINTSVLADNAP